MSDQATYQVSRGTADVIGPAERAAWYDGLGMAIIEDAIFLEAWARGRIPDLHAFFRARQVLRANPHWRCGLDRPAGEVRRPRLE